MFFFLLLLLESLHQSFIFVGRMDDNTAANKAMLFLAPSDEPCMSAGMGYELLLL